MFFISIFSMLAVFLLAGFAAQKVLKYSFSVTGAMMIGFLFLFSVFHVIAYAFLRLSLPFTQLFWLSFRSGKPFPPEKSYHHALR